MDKNRVFKAKALHYWLNFTERLAEIILHRSPDSYDVTLEKCVPYGQGKYNNLDIIRPKTGTGKKLPLMIYVHGKRRRRCEYRLYLGAVKTVSVSRSGRAGRNRFLV